VLEGYSVFTAEHASSAGKQLLENGPVRLKPVHATAGRGQKVIQNLSELAEALTTMAPAEWADAGLVLEENLTSVTTYSVGQVRVADLTATYYGSQRLTNDNAGDEVYGGSDLVVVRGDFDALSQLPVPENIASRWSRPRSTMPRQKCSPECLPRGATMTLLRDQCPRAVAFRRSGAVLAHRRRHWG
jgi:hypothetical protein